MSIVRGCGTRVMGGVYAETLTGPHGHPLECFITDPPVPVDVDSIGLTPVGVKLIRRGDVTHIFDWVGGGLVRVGPLCAVCSASRVESAQNPVSIFPGSTDLGSTQITTGTSRDRQAHDDISMDSLDDEVRSDVGENPSHGTHDIVSPTLGAVPDNNARRRGVRPDDELGSQPFGQNRSGGRDGDSGPVLDDEAASARLPLNMDHDRPLPIDDASDIGPFSRGESGKHTNLRQESILPNHCTCQWKPSGFYPNVTDFIEEVRRYGASRRLPSTLDLSALDARSMLVLIHSRASIKESDLSAYNTMLALDIQDRQYDNVPIQRCPAMVKALHDVGMPTSAHPGCARTWWYQHLHDKLEPGQRYQREMPSFNYRAGVRAAFHHDFKPAIFLTLPIHQIAVVRDPNGSHEKPLAKVQEMVGGKLPWELVDE